MIFQQRSRSFAGKPKLRGEDIHRSERQQTESSVGPGDTVHHFVDGAVAAGRDDRFETFRRRVPRERLSFAGTRGAHTMAIHGDRLHLARASAVPDRCGPPGLRITTVSFMDADQGGLWSFLQTRTA